MNVVFFNIGCPSYLSASIQQAALHNEVTLIGDDSNKHVASLKNVRHVNYKTVFVDGDRFISKYVHLSSNTREFELLSFIRWFCIRNFLRDEKISQCFYSDSDNLIYTKIAEAHNNLGSPSLALNIPQHQPQFRDSAAATSSFWSNESLEDFCDFLFLMYEDDKTFNNLLKPKWNHHHKNSISGGICDMTALWHFSNKVGDVSVLTKVSASHCTFDHNINSSENHLREEYPLLNKRKDIKMKNGQPYCFNLIKNIDVAFHTLHFQGPAKNLINSYSTYNDY
tara:strand:- start:1861 stop:2703 length:843 start_codon:yes stop_codon:yes gene_type:complete